MTYLPFAQCLCLCVTQSGLVLRAACWSYVNRAVSHLLWPGWESSGGPGSHWVPGLHVIHSLVGGQRGEAQFCPNPNSEGKWGTEEGGRKGKYCGGECVKGGRDGVVKDDGARRHFGWIGSL